MRADETRRLVPLHRLLPSALPAKAAATAAAAEQKLSCNGTVPEAIITVDSDD